MAIKFYLGQKDSLHEIHCNTNSTITEIAGTFDLGTLELEWNECKYAIFPNTPIYIEETNTDSTWNFIVNEDNVEVVKKTNSVKYLHKLTISQSIHRLNNVPLRNSVFTQPYNSQKKYNKNTFFVINTNYGNWDGSNYHFINNDSEMYFDLNTNTESICKDYQISLKSQEKIKSAKIRFSSMIMTFKDSTYKSEVGYNEISYMLERVENQYINRVTFRIINSSNSSDYLEFSINSPNLNTELILTTSEINWLITTKKFYIQLISGSVDSIASIVANTVPTANSRPACGFFDISLNIESYYYSLWDVLNTINEQAKKLYNHNGYSDFFTMPGKTTGQGLELDSIIAPEFNFTQMDLYEAVAKVLSFIDAFPIIKADTISGISYDNVLGYEYLNDLSKDIIDNLQMNDVKTTLNETNFTNKLASFYQNGKLTTPITYPQKNMFIRPATSNYGVPDKNDWYFMLSKPIDYIDKCLVELTTDNTGTGIVKINRNSTDVYYMFVSLRLFTTSQITRNIQVDITKCIYEQDVYNKLKIGYASNGMGNKYNSLYYNKGDNKIYCGITGEILAVGNHDVLQYVLEFALGYNCGFGLHYEMSVSYTNLKQNYKFNCTYHPIVDGKVAQESTFNKVEKETIVAQANSGTELNRLGNNLQGLIAKLGNEEKAITLPITKMKDKIKIGTHYIDELGNNWIANKIQTTFTTDKEKVIVNATFTKNFNAMQQFTSLNQEKRFYEISEKLTHKGYENYNEFIYFTSRSDLSLSSLVEKVALWEFGIKSIISKTFGVETGISDYFTVCENVTMSSPQLATFICPIVYGCGNQICIEMGFDSSILANRRYYDGQTEAWLYTEDDGFANGFDIECRYKLKSFFDDPYKYPEAEMGTVFVGERAFLLNEVQYYKKPNEIFHVNYSICFLPYWNKTIDDLGTPQYVYEEIFFGDKFINENGIIPNTDFDNGKQRKFRLYYGDTKYSIIDNIGHDDFIDNVQISVDVNNIETTVDGCKFLGEITVLKNSQVISVSNCSSWAITDENGNIYISVNKNENSGSDARLRFFTSRFRKV